LRAVGIALAAIAGLAGVAQLVPYGRDHSNPPVLAEPAWNDPSTRTLAVRACFDCHSNETRWPWYSNVAPASWLLQHHVDEGRKVLNFSDWTRHYKEAGESAETVREGSMPPREYVLLHGEARLSPAEKQALTRGLAATLGTSAEEEEEDEDDD
jgi:hypothetical protein